MIDEETILKATVTLDEILGDGAPYILLVGNVHTATTSIATTQSEENTAAILEKAAVDYRKSLKKQAN